MTSIFEKTISFHVKSMEVDMVSWVNDILTIFLKRFILSIVPTDSIAEKFNIIL
jgi:hypothetical protein